ncbi:MAG: Nif3-like dinuclear metal center hexameric protein [Thiohalophilus sp.]|uniref:Nif3-like dinuclear metal center hexameric protein n=1 Tax=Thiohalophilus sp. TaxID=3028392 RepID=UPI00286FE4B1|nr:Nif3-like dinuclear metal center hexameric protein [Thiohalophilus sp.]MDR9435705.1 Nif3-like dinuclear metal center hexameric protein [Thiohalophilus sp.]
MVQLSDLVRYLDDLLEVERFTDYCPNGLQVEGSVTINRLVCGVTASQALIEAAVEAGADALLVHHGYFWKGEAAPIVGIKKRRIARLLENKISLLAYHLPLDAHPVYGNNVQLAKVLGLKVAGSFGPPGNPAIGLYGGLPEPLSGEALAGQIAERLGRAPLHVGEAPAPVSKLAWCTGGAQGLIEEAIRLGVDAYLTGEVSEQTVHLARENGIHFYAAGHHATERYGARALGEHVAEHFGIEQQFIDIDNPA